MAQVRDNYHALVRREVLELVPQDAGKVLDVGGGVGASSAFLKTAGKATGAVLVDLVADEHHPEIDAAYGGNLEDPELLRRIGVEQGPFNTILCLDVLEHITDPWSVVGRLRDMLSPGGVIVASIPNVRNYRLVVPLVIHGKFELKDSGILDRTHLRWFVEDTAVRLFTEAGMEVEVLRKHFVGPKKTLFNLLTLGLFRNFLTIQFYIRARKPDAEGAPVE